MLGDDNKPSSYRRSFWGSSLVSQLVIHQAQMLQKVDLSGVDSPGHQILGHVVGLGQGGILDITDLVDQGLGGLLGRLVGADHCPCGSMRRRAWWNLGSMRKDSLQR